MSEMSVREWQEAFRRGEFSAPDFETQVKAGWYDWFCEEEELAGKTALLGEVICDVIEGGKLDVDGTHPFFMNCCPASDDPLYDSLRFNDGKDNVFVCNFGDERDIAPVTVYSSINGYKDPVARFDEPGELSVWLSIPWLSGEKEHIEEKAMAETAKALGKAADHLEKEGMPEADAVRREWRRLHDEMLRIDGAARGFRAMGKPWAVM